MVKPKSIALFNPLYQGSQRETQTFGSWLKNLLLVTIGFFGFVICLTLLFLAMRGVMDLGGFVATGGPYQIEHQAPNWIWILPVSIVSGIIFLFIYTLFANKLGGLKLTSLAWPALFCSLGYNFLAYSFIPEAKGGGIAIGWLICGVLFELMGGIPLLIIIKETFRYIGQRDFRSQLREEAAQKYRGEDNQSYLPTGLISFSIFIINMAGIAGGIYLGVTFFNHIAK
jgi:hypothetical protein